MMRNVEQESVSEPPSLPRLSFATRLRRSADPFLVVCRCFSLLTGLISLLCIFVNILSAVRSFRDGSDIFDGIFRCYAVFFAFFVVLAETEWNFIIKFSKVFEYWVGRGMLQILYVLVSSESIFILVMEAVAVMTRAFPDYVGQRREIVLLQNIASYMLLACGVVYTISGLLCIGSLKRSRQQQQISRDQAVKDLEELERRREELEQLLVAQRT